MDSHICKSLLVLLSSNLLPELELVDVGRSGDDLEVLGHGDALDELFGKVLERPLGEGNGRVDGDLGIGGSDADDIGELTRLALNLDGLDEELLKGSSVNLQKSRRKKTSLASARVWKRCEEEEGTAYDSFRFRPGEVENKLVGHGLDDLGSLLDLKGDSSDAKSGRKKNEEKKREEKVGSVREEVDRLRTPTETSRGPQQSESN